MNDFDKTFVLTFYDLFLQTQLNCDRKKKKI